MPTLDSATHLTFASAVSARHKAALATALDGGVARLGSKVEKLCCMAKGSFPRETSVDR